MTARVFLLDDHEIVRRGVHDLLEAEDDLEVVGDAATAAQALERVPLCAPDLAVLDVQLPDGNGVEVCRELRSSNPELRCVMLTSFSERRRRAALRLLPGVATSASGARFAAALLFASIGAAPLVRASLRGLHAVQIPVRALALDTVSPARLRAYQRAGVEVHVWTVNDEPEMRRLLALGVDGLVTDRADLALEVVRSLG